jgi:hypothetical protein
VEVRITPFVACVAPVLSMDWRERSRRCCRTEARIHHEHVPLAACPLGRLPPDGAVPYSLPSLAWISGATRPIPVTFVFRKVDWRSVPSLVITKTTLPPVPAAVEPRNCHPGASALCNQCRPITASSTSHEATARSISTTKSSPGARATEDLPSGQTGVQLLVELAA